LEWIIHVAVRGEGLSFLNPTAWRGSLSIVPVICDSHALWLI
jgi:hypothetical protein